MLGRGQGADLAGLQQRKRREMHVMNFSAVREVDCDEEKTKGGAEDWKSRGSDTGGRHDFASPHPNSHYQRQH